jgi:alkanesulfonate monooxygenase SsuD/methylene tetrahydromethanopterin reductase-like flavin-dependent oxidoreductase (luciferase family)
VFFGPQVAWRDVAKLAGVFREASAEAGSSTPGFVAASRSLIVGKSKEAAATAAREYLEKTFAMYRAWEMQEKTMAPLQLGFDIPLDDWTVHGSPADCVEIVRRAEAMGLDRIGFTIYSLPREVEARIDYMRMIAEEILRPAGALA